MHFQKSSVSLGEGGGGGRAKSHHISPRGEGGVEKSQNLLT